MQIWYFNNFTVSENENAFMMEIYPGHRTDQAAKFLVLSMWADSS